MSISNKAVLVTLSIGFWAARKNDNAAALDTEQAHRADAGSCNVIKSLVQKSTTELYKKAATAARAYHEGATLPWINRGPRLLPTTNFFEYTSAMQQHKALFWKAADDFLFQYEISRQAARQMLGTMYNNADYPDPARIRRLFHFDVDHSLVPDPSDFRVAIGAEEEKMIRDEITAKLNARLSAAVLDTWNRLADAVKKLHERMNDPAATFHNTLIENLRELTDTLPRLNITDDPALTKVMQDITNRLISEPEELRADKALRSSTAAAAKEILDRIDSYKETLG